ncbi:hypothetical protein I6E29_00470 [Arcanobacterium haemolyticum]|nr:hypothetical protein [Arcanobacterium haemolyticum]
MKLTSIRLGAAFSAATIATMGAVAAHADDSATGTPALSPVFTTMYDVTYDEGANTALVPTNFGIARSAYLTFTGSDGKDYATNYAAVSQLESSTIVDVDHYASPALNIVLTNTTDSPLAVDTNEWCLPSQSSKASACGPLSASANGTPTLSSTANSTTMALQVRAAGQSQYQTLSDFTTNGNALADIQSVRTTGTLAANETVTIRVPLTFTAEGQAITYNPYSWSTVQELNAPRLRPNAGNQKIVARFRFAHRSLNADGTDTLTSTDQYIGAVRDRSKDEGANADTSTFTSVPDKIQAMLPNQQISDVIYVTNSDLLANLTGSENPALYSGGLWRLDLTRIKASLAGSGWSVNNIAPSGAYDINASQLADVYSYGPYDVGSSATITDPETGESARQASRATHVELYQYVEGHDLSLYTGDTYSTRNSLDWVRTYNGVAVAEGNAQAPSSSQATHDGTTCVSDENYPSNVCATTNVDTSRPGVYTTTFKLTLNDGESVYKSVNVTVNPRLTFDKNSDSHGDSGEQDLGTLKATYNQPAIYSNDEESYLSGPIPEPESFVDANGNTWHFQGWNTQADGQGTALDVNAPVTADTTYYAQWTMEPAPTLSGTSSDGTQVATEGATPSGSSPRELSFTGASVGVTALLGLALASAGAIALRRRA